MKKIGKLATYPARQDNLREMLPTVLPQLDELTIYCNQYHETQLEKLKRWVENHAENCSVKVLDGKNEAGDIKDMGKFYGIEEATGYIFLLDDDLLYPENYTQRHVKAIQLHRCVTCVHGRKITNKPISNYFGHTRSFHYRRPLSSPEDIDIPGTGTVAFDSDYLPKGVYDNPSFLDTFKGIADIWFACQASMFGLKIKALARKSGWLTDTRSATGGSLYEQTKKDDTRVCKILNKFLI